MNVSYQVEKKIGSERFLFQRGYDRYQRSGEKVRVEVYHWRTFWGDREKQWHYHGTWDTVREATAEIKRNVEKGNFER